MITKICLVCNEEFKTISSKKKYCSKKCLFHNYYIKHKDKIKKRVKQYNKNNPLKNKEYHKKAIKNLLLKNPAYFREASKKNYNKNKSIWWSRSNTNVVLGLCNELCKICKKRKGEWHHEVYPIRNYLIRKAYEDGKIFPICKDCHESYHSKDKAKVYKHIK